MLYNGALPFVIVTDMSSQPVKSVSVQLLLENTDETFLNVSELLLKFASNVLNNPENPKYRRIRVGNNVVSERLLPVNGAIECLFEMGFEEDGDYFTLPSTALLDDMTQIRDELLSERQKILGQKPSSSQVVPPSGASIGGASGGGAIGDRVAVGGAAAMPQIPMSDWAILISEAKFCKKIHTSYWHVLMYEDSSLQQKARFCMPLDQLRENARKQCGAYNQTYSTPPSEAIDMKDLLLLELLAWFKHDFFHWVDAPKCEGCGGATHGEGSAEPTHEELEWGAVRVENYQCDACGRHTRFPRYNHPEKLLETRRGRCGEWANCFTLCCRAIGFEARYVLDWTDHVWTEVFSESQNRWLHCDPCENVCDKPLLYEAGWGKKLTYIMAFSKDDIQDVTWRYSAKHVEVLSRRRECRENWLVQVILKLRQERQNSLPENRKKQLQGRLVTEVVEFLTIKNAGEGELTGRTSGSITWRLARGETDPCTNLAKSTTVKPTESEKAQKFLYLKYSCAADEYVRVSSGGERVKGWQEMVSEVKDIHRKEENDWKMAYLARREGTDSASISWKFDFTESELLIDKVEVQALTDCFENGQVRWMVCGGGQCVILPPGGVRTRTQDFAGSVVFTLTADLSQGRGSVAWQHTQLFRQKMDETSVFPLEIKIWLK